MLVGLLGGLLRRIELMLLLSVSVAIVAGCVQLIGGEPLSERFGTGEQAGRVRAFGRLRRLRAGGIVGRQRRGCHCCATHAKQGDQAHSQN